MCGVLTRPEGVCTASACVIVPLLVTVIVILPVFETLGLAGVILNSVSLRLGPPEPPVATADPVALELDAEAGLVALVLLPDEPQPASSAAAANGANIARRLISGLPRVGF
jgi:hypothetical protein